MPSSSFPDFIAYPPDSLSDPYGTPADTGYLGRILSKARGVVRRPPGPGERLFGPGFGAMTDRLSELATQGMFGDQPGPVDVLMNALPLAAGAAGLAKGAQSAWRALTAESPGLESIGSDLYALSQGPIGRRQLMYRMTGLPGKAAKARAAMSPQVLEKAVETLKSLPSFPIGPRSLALNPVREEGELLTALQDKYGVLNSNLELANNVSGDDIGTALKNAAYWSVDNGGKLVRDVADLGSAVSPNTERKYRDLINTIRRTQTPQTLTSDTSITSPLREELKVADKERRAAGQEIYEKAKTAIDKVKGAAARKLGLENTAYPDALWQNDAGKIAEREAALDKWHKTQQAILEVAQPKLGRIHAARNRMVDRIERKPDAIAQNLNAAIKATVKATAAPDNPIEFLNSALEHFNRSLEYYNKSTDYTGGNAIRYATDGLRESVSRIGGPLGHVARDLAESVIAGTQTVEGAMKDLASGTLTDYLGFKVDLPAAVKDSPVLQGKSEVLTAIENLNARRATTAAARAAQDKAQSQSVPSDSLLSKLKSFGTWFNK